jgi:protein-tyrosine-phosphatase
MAHVMLERMLADRGVDGVRVRSGGVANYARDGMLPSLDARLVLREIGIVVDENAFASVDLRAHPDVVAAADVIVTMTDQQRQMLAPLLDGRSAPIFTLRELAGDGGDIGDPATLGEDVFRSCRDDIARCLDQSFARLLALLHR